MSGPTNPTDPADPTDPARQGYPTPGYPMNQDYSGDPGYPDRQGYPSGPGYPAPYQPVPGGLPAGQVPPQGGFPGGPVFPGWSPAPAPPKNRFWVGFASGFGAAAVLAAFVLGAVLVIRMVASSGTFDIPGTLSLTGSTTTSGLPAGFECAGAGGYDDIIPGTEVTVSDESGTILGKGELSSSTGGSGYCDFEFTIHDVPRGKHFYDVEVSQRGALSFTEEEAESGLSLTLGT